MAKVFLDTNFVLDIAFRKKEVFLMLNDNSVAISPLSLHILCYVNKIKIPNDKLQMFLEEYEIVNLTKNLIKKCIIGPTNDLEDNIQLHSASESECDIFLTNDKKLLKMKFFGKMRIVSII